MWGESTAGRTVTARLRHPGPDGGRATASRGAFRSTELRPRRSRQQRRVPARRSRRSCSRTPSPSRSTSRSSTARRRRPARCSCSATGRSPVDRQPGRRDARLADRRDHIDTGGLNLARRRHHPARATRRPSGRRPLRARARRRRGPDRGQGRRGQPDRHRPARARRRTRPRRAVGARAWTPPAWSSRSARTSTGCSVGDEVMAAVSPRRPEGGAQQELLVVPAASVVPIPDGATLVAGGDAADERPHRVAAGSSCSGCSAGETLAVDRWRRPARART